MTRPAKTSTYMHTHDIAFLMVFVYIVLRLTIPLTAKQDAGQIVSPLLKTELKRKARLAT